MFLMVCSRRREARELGKSEKNESRFAMDRFSSMSGVILHDISMHLANPYASMPMVGTCRRVFTTFTTLRLKRHELALGELRNLNSWLRKLEAEAVASGDPHGGQVDVREVALSLCDIEDIMRGPFIVM